MPEGLASILTALIGGEYHAFWVFSAAAMASSYRHRILSSESHAPCLWIFWKQGQGPQKYGRSFFLYRPRSRLPRSPGHRDPFPPVQATGQEYLDLFWT